MWKWIVIVLFSIPCYADEAPASSDHSMSEARPSGKTKEVLPFFPNNLVWVLTGVSVLFASSFAKTKRKVSETAETTTWLENHSGDLARDYDPLDGLTLDAPDPKSDSKGSQEGTPGPSE